MQSYYEKNPANTFAEFKIAIEKMYERYPYQKIQEAFVTLQMVMNQIIEHCGGNDFSLDHIQKRRKGGLNLLHGDIVGRVRIPDPDSPICLNVTPTARLWGGDTSWDTDSKIPTDYETD